ncbi:hypothetical protein ACFWAR_01660 [Streptomyces sp. NPDC059917]|uniref:hypothetical protein n=1 Tax=Streptomyces sp. NPDC059917 TaxID=3347002 RepID=UPI00365764FF
MSATTTAATAPAIDWDLAFCSEGANCFRFGLDADGRAYIGTTGSAAYVSDSREALRALITAVKGGAADHLLV